LKTKIFSYLFLVKRKQIQTRKGKNSSHFFSSLKQQ